MSRNNSFHLATSECNKCEWASVQMCARDWIFHYVLSRFIWQHPRKGKRGSGSTCSFPTVRPQQQTTQHSVWTLRYFFCVALTVARTRNSYREYRVISGLEQNNDTFSFEMRSRAEYPGRTSKLLLLKFVRCLILRKSRSNSKHLS